MNLAIMQPYIFPYIGYFQLVAAVDRFLFLDDANFIKQGWINRNRLELAGRVAYFTIPLSGASPNRRINELSILDPVQWRRRLLRSIRESYATAPFLVDVMRLLEEVLDRSGPRISDAAALSVEITARNLGLGASFGATSALYPRSASTGVDRVQEICASEQASRYVNLPGGKALYSREQFDARGLALDFIEPDLGPYPRAGRIFIPGLSILDAMLFNEPDVVARIAKGRVAP